MTPESEQVASPVDPEAGARPEASGSVNAETPSPRPDAPGAPSSGSKAPKRRHLGRNITLGVLGLALVLFVAALLWGLSPNEAKPYDDGVDFELTERNTLAFGAVSNLGIADPVVAMVPDDARVTYDLARSPANEEWVGDEDLVVAPDDLQRAVIGAIAEVVPTVERLVVEQWDAGVHAQTWDVLMSDVFAFFDGTITFEEFESRIMKT